MFESELIEAIKKNMLDKADTIAVAESVTSGLLQTAFASAENASLFFQGGLTVYNIGQKARHMQVDPIHALSCNCVSDKIAEQMALQVCPFFQSDWGIGVTGYAAPTPQSDNKLFAYYAISFRGAVLTKGRIDATCDIPFNVQLLYVQTILKELLILQQ